MIINHTQTELHAAHKFYQYHSAEKTIGSWVGNAKIAMPVGDETAISAEGKALQSAAAVVKPQDRQDNLSAMHKFEVSLVSSVVSNITGKTFHLVKPSDITPKSLATTAYAQEKQPSSTEDLGIIYNHYERNSRSQGQRIEATAKVHTSDKQTIDISVSVEMSSNFIAKQQVQIPENGKITEPFHLQFEGDTQEFSRYRFLYDIDLDGKPEQVSIFRSEGGMLAIDLNADGKISDSKELLAKKQSSNSAATENNNGTIATNDSLYNQLRIWQRGEKGKDTLFALGQKGVGALYVGNIATPHLLHSDAPSTDGKPQKDAVAHINLVA